MSALCCLTLAACTGGTAGTGGNGGGCTSSADCPGGSICTNNVCEQLCTSQAHCPTGQVCGQDGRCVDPTGPQILGIVGNDPADGTRIVDGVVVSGVNLTAAAFELQQNGVGPTLTARSVSATTAELVLPVDVLSGDYMLVATNSAGSAQAPVTLTLPELNGSELVTRLNDPATTGVLRIERLPVGSTAADVAGGNHRHDATYLTLADFAASVYIPADASAASPRTLGPGEALDIAHNFGTVEINADVWISSDAGATYQHWTSAAGGTFPPSTAADGDLTVSNTLPFPAVNTTVSGAAGASQLVLSSAAGFAVGDEILVVQSQGDGAGQHELAIITTLNGSSATLDHLLAHTYVSGGSNKAQVQRVPHYGALTIASGGVLTASVWDAAQGTGGILALRAQSIDVQAGGAIRADGAGYVGGPAGAAACDYHLGTQGEGELAAGGEAGSRNGMGGGGGCGQAGGGGGGHSGPGNNGVKSGCYVGGGCGMCPSAASAQALGGAPGADAPGSGRILFGGGGAASGSHSSGGRNGASGGNGGNGGGIIMLWTDSMTLAGQVTAHGAMGQNGYPATAAAQPIGGGGGGAGGTILVSAGTLSVNGGRVQAFGGQGGGAAELTSCSPSGAGGDGALGRVAIEYDQGDAAVAGADTVTTPRGLRAGARQLTLEQIDVNTLRFTNRSQATLEAVAVVRR